LVMYESRVCLGGGIIESARMGGQPVVTGDLQSLAD